MENLKQIKDAAGKRHYVQELGIVHGIVLYRCFHDKKQKNGIGYIGQVCEGVGGYVSKKPDEAIESALDYNDALKKSAKQITTSVGNVYNAAKLASYLYGTVYVCYDIKTGKQRGYVCHSQNKVFGPLCPSRQLARDLAAQVLKARTK